VGAEGTYCAFCNTDRVSTKKRGRILAVACKVCLAIYRIEFAPPDDPTIKARISSVRTPKLNRD
jgi:hypothetical protein